MLHLDSAEGQRDRHKQGGQQIGNADGFFPDEIETDAENQHRADQREVVQGSFCQQRLDQTGKQGDASLKNSHRYGREETAFSQGRCHDHDDHKVQQRFGSQGTVITVNAVLYGTDYCHGANADGHGCGDEGIEKLIVALISALVTKPATEVFHFLIQIQ